MRVQTEVPSTDALAPGDMRIYNVDSSVDLILQGDRILAGLSPKTVAKVKDELARSASEDTSGLGGTFPRGITIGSVVQELKTAEVWTRTYLVRPAVAPSHITSVLVLTPQRVTQGTGNVWGATVNADSATRRITAAGDSIARQAAAVEAQARAAVLDSVRRATADSVRRSLGAVPLTPPAADSSRPRRDTARVDTARIRPR